MVYSFTPLPAQKWLLEPPVGFTEGHDVAYLQGGLGSGKTLPAVLGCLLLAWQLSKKVPGITGLVCAATNTILDRSTIPEFQDVMEKWGLVEKRDYRFNRTKKIMTFNCWSNARIIFASLDKSNSVRSINAGFAMIEEASLLKSKKDFVEVLGRVRQPGLDLYRILVISNPEESPGWMAEQFPPSGEIRIDEEKTEDEHGNERIGKVLFRKMIAASIDNHHLPPSQIALYRQTMTPEQFAVFVMGQDARITEGLVCPNFGFGNITECRHDPLQATHLFCDFNFDPCCWGIGQRREGSFFMVDELCHERTDIERMCDAFIERFPPERLKGGLIINGDASGENNSLGMIKPKEARKDEKSSYYTYMRHAFQRAYGKGNVRFALRKANTSIHERVMAFNAQVCNADGESHVFIDPSCKRFIQCLKNLRYKEGCNDIDIPTPAQIAKDKTLKWLRDDPFDAISYWVQFYAPLSIPRVKETAEYGRKMKFSV
jgi:hypothetical protein